MRLVRSASEDEVIAAFLRAEIDSDRFGQGILAALEADHRPRAIVDSAILRDPEENMYRRSLLGRVRGWGRGEGMFQGFPAEVEWNLAAVTPKELAEVRYIAWDWWLDRSAGTRLPPSTPGASEQVTFQAIQIPAFAITSRLHASCGRARRSLCSSSSV